MSADVLFDPKGSGFDEPFEMLDACHGRVRAMLALLDRLRDHLHNHGAETQAQQAARDVMRYFDIAAPAHHEDEERHVFPALLAADATQWGTLVQRLQADHRQMATAWIDARALLADVEAGHWDQSLAASSDVWTRFAGLYAEHLIVEEKIAFPAAQAALSGANVAAMGSEMAARRGVSRAQPA